MSFSELSMQVDSNSRPVKRASYFQLMAVCKSLSPVFVRVLYTCRNTWTRIQLLSIELNRAHANTFLINRRQCYVIVRVDARFHRL